MLNYKIAIRCSLLPKHLLFLSVGKVNSQGVQLTGNLNDLSDYRTGVGSSLIGEHKRRSLSDALRGGHDD